MALPPVPWRRAARSGQMRLQRGVLLACHRLREGYRGGAAGCVIDHECQVPLGSDHAMVVGALEGGGRVVVVASGDYRIGLEGGRVRWSSELEQGHLDAVTGGVAVVGDVVAATKCRLAARFPAPIHRLK